VAATGTLWMSRELDFDNRDHRTSRDVIFYVSDRDK
jgi:hypothetical protein